MNEATEQSNSGTRTQDAGLGTQDPGLRQSPSQKAWRRFRQNRPALLSAWLLAALIIIVLGWPLVLKAVSMVGPAGARFAQSHDPDRVSEEQFQTPGVRHWCGTDVHGRDLLSRALYGAQV